MNAFQALRYIILYFRGISEGGGRYCDIDVSMASSFKELKNLLAHRYSSAFATCNRISEGDSRSLDGAQSLQVWKRSLFKNSSFETSKKVLQRGRESKRGRVRSGDRNWRCQWPRRAHLSKYERVQDFKAQKLIGGIRPTSVFTMCNKTF
jgi:hypothetical protein